MIIAIDENKLEKSKYTDVRIVSYKEPTTKEKGFAVLEFTTKKIIYAANEDELIEQIEDVLEE